MAKPSNLNPAVGSQTPQSPFPSKSQRRTPTHDEKRPIPQATLRAASPSDGCGWVDARDEGA